MTRTSPSSPTSLITFLLASIVESCRLTLELFRNVAMLDLSGPMQTALTMTATAIRNAEMAVMRVKPQMPFLSLPAKTSTRIRMIRAARIP